jgi:hypothetical protein
MPSATYTSRDGRSVPVDAAFLAWTSGDLSAMLAATSVSTNEIDRHHLLQCIVEATYKNRADTRMRDLCGRHARTHLEEFPRLAPVLKRHCGGTLPRVTTFQYYATLLVEASEYDLAVDVCKVAMSYGLHDGTASGYAGRIARILTKRK